MLKNPVVYAGLVALLALGGWTWSVSLTTLPAWGQEVDVISVHQQWLDAISRGNVDAAIALLVEDAVYEGGFGCDPRACFGTSAIRREIETQVRQRAQYTRVTAHLSRTTWMRWSTIVSELRMDAVRAAGADRIVVAQTVALRGEKIVSVRDRVNRRDPQTARFLASLPPPPRPAAQRPTPTDYGRFVDVGGRRIYLECLGKGKPTVIIESGLAGGGASTKIWNGDPPHVTIQPDIARTARTCVYDRAGYGLSDRGPTPRTGLTNVRDLRAMLRNAGIEPPYVLVGFSLGGPSVQLYASEYPDEVAGLVTLDSTLVNLNERLWKVIPPALAEEDQDYMRSDFAQVASPQGPGGGFDLWVAFGEFRRAGPLPDVPMSVLVAGIPPAYGFIWPNEAFERVQQLRLDMQAELAGRVPNGRMEIVDNSGHLMNIYAPGRVSKAVIRVVEEVRDRQLRQRPGLPER